MSTYLNDYDYFLPEELIGQKPREPRDSAKLMLVNRKTGSIEHKQFDIYLYFLIFLLYKVAKA